MQDSDGELADTSTSSLDNNDVQDADFVPSVDCHNENMPDYPFTDLDVTVLADLDVSPSDSTQPRGAPPGAVTPNAPPEPASSQAPATSAATSSREHGDDDMVAEHGYARPPQRGPATTPAVHADA